jgi:hypothetical protein
MRNIDMPNTGRLEALQSSLRLQSNLKPASGGGVFQLNVAAMQASQLTSDRQSNPRPG